MEEDHTASFISALAHLQPEVEVEVLHADPDPEHDADPDPELDTWSVPQLKAEIHRLRRALALARREIPLPVPAELEVLPPIPHLFPFAPVPVDVPITEPPEQGSARPSAPAANPDPDADADAEPAEPSVPVEHPAPHAPPPAQTQAQAPNRRRRKRSSPPPAARTASGKRVERGRRVELARALRARMRAEMGVREDEALPPPVAGGPDWVRGPADEENVAWVERVCAAFVREAGAGAWPKVPPEDLREDIVKTAARTAFANFCKRYLVDVDPLAARRQERNIKKRRRWARKDLKRRAKAAQDAAFADLSPAALHIDYMSSEYSSAGEDDPDEASGAGFGLALPDLRRAHWLDVLREQAPATGRGWAEGVSEKVLEVRTPTWRSARLDDIYRRLDTISAASAALRATPAAAAAAAGDKPAGLRLGHVAPSHCRFTLPGALMRRGRAPRDRGEAWMWASGETGVWPASEREVVQAVQAVEAAAEGGGGEGGVGGEGGGGGGGEGEGEGEAEVQVQVAGMDAPDAVVLDVGLDGQMMEMDADALVEWTGEA